MATRKFGNFLGPAPQEARVPLKGLVLKGNQSEKQQIVPTKESPIFPVVLSMSFCPLAIPTASRRFFWRRQATTQTWVGEVKAGRSSLSLVLGRLHSRFWTSESGVFRMGVSPGGVLPPFEAHWTAQIVGPVSLGNYGVAIFKGPFWEETRPFPPLQADC